MLSKRNPQGCNEISHWNWHEALNCSTLGSTVVKMPYYWIKSQIYAESLSVAEIGFRGYITLWVLSGFFSGSLVLN